VISVARALVKLRRCGVTDPLERLAFAIGIKPALRLRLGARAAGREIERFERAGAAVARGADDLVYVAREEAWARALLRVEGTVLPGGPPRPAGPHALAAHREVGRLLGYPACCVDGFLARLERGVHRLADGTVAAELVVASVEADARSSRRLGRLNCTLPRRRALVPFDPCRLDCPHASRYVGALFEALSSRLPGPARQLRRRLLAPMRLTRSGQRLGAADPGPALLTLRFDGF